jgi:hypothetical protein
MEKVGEERDNQVLPHPEKARRAGNGTNEVRFGAMVLAYKQEEYIAYCLRALAPHLDQIVVLFSERPWIAYNSRARQSFTAADGSREILAELQRELPHLSVIEGTWDGEEEMRDHGLRALRNAGTDVCVMVDADEMYPDGGLAALKGEIARRNTPGTAYYMRYMGCYRRFDYVLETRYPRSTGGVSVHRAPVAVHLDPQTTFYMHRNPSGHVVELPESFFFWHFGYVLSDARMWEKIHTFGHAQQIVPRWFEEKWLQWTPATADLFFKEPRSRWPRTIKIDAQSLPQVMHQHPYFSGNGHA